MVCSNTTGRGGGLVDSSLFGLVIQMAGLLGEGLTRGILGEELVVRNIEAREEFCDILEIKGGI